MRINLWKKTDLYKSMGHNVRSAIEKTLRRQKHSDFYYKLNDLCSKVYMYNETYSGRLPFYEKAFKLKLM